MRRLHTLWARRMHTVGVDIYTCAETHDVSGAASCVGPRQPIDANAAVQAATHDPCLLLWLSGCTESW